jgi:hypothetical protein
MPRIHMKIDTNTDPNEQRAAIYERIDDALEAQEALSLSFEELKLLFPDARIVKLKALPPACRHLLTTAAFMGHTLYNDKGTEMGKAAMKLIELGLAEVDRETEAKIDIKPTRAGSALAGYEHDD